jgi:hypothetical protein
MASMSPFPAGVVIDALKKLQDTLRGIYIAEVVANVAHVVVNHKCKLSCLLSQAFLDQTGVRIIWQTFHMKVNPIMRLPKNDSSCITHPKATFTGNRVMQ